MKDIATTAEVLSGWDYGDMLSLYLRFRIYQALTDFTGRIEVLHSMDFLSFVWVSVGAGGYPCSEFRCGLQVYLTDTN